MQKESLNLIVNCMLVILLLVTIFLVANVTRNIYTDGGKCTASPLGYARSIVEEDNPGFDYSCSCSRDLTKDNYSIEGFAMP